MKKVLLSLILLLSFASYSQNINDYQYVIVPKKFTFLKEADKYGLNTTVKLLLQKYGFKAYFDDESFAEENNGNRCDFLSADLVNESGFMITKLKVSLKDCKGNVVYQTQMGSSRDKKYTVAYNQALRAAAQSFETLNYSYTGKSVTNQVSPSEVVEEITTVTPDVVPSSNSGVFFFAQPIPNGYQVVNSEPKVVMRLFITSQKNVFLAVRENRQGVVILKNNQWFFEYYENGNLVSESINLKF